MTIYQLECGSLIAECKCKSSTVIKASEPKLELDWGENSSGILCRLTHPHVLCNTILCDRPAEPNDIFCRECRDDVTEYEKEKARNA
jgi:hypothetical protein